MPGLERLLVGLAALVCAAGCSPKHVATRPSSGGWLADRTNGPALICQERNAFYYVGEPVRFYSREPLALRYEVRDYWGQCVEAARVVPRPDHTVCIQPKVDAPGWYRLYVTLDDGHTAATTFCRVRRTADFPVRPDPGTPGGDHPAEDEVMRGLCGLGPQRLRVPDLSDVSAAIHHLQVDVDLDRQFYLPYDPYRQRALMTAFPNGTSNLTAVKAIVDHFKDTVLYWEPRNEPNFGSSGTAFALNEQRPFYQAVKSVDPNLRVLGPGTVNISPSMTPWLTDFFAAGGGRYVDGFSFHAYNNLLGDVFLARRSLDALDRLLKLWRVDGLERWQTEQGYFACNYGVYQPRHQAQWTMLEMMLFEQYGIPKEHNHLWYDRSHGFWDMPTWWENGDGSLNPVAVLMRVWSEELHGTRFHHALDFGDPGNKLVLGSLFTGPGRQVGVFMTTGASRETVELQAAPHATLRIVDSFGRVCSATPADGRYALAVTELPTYIELSDSQLNVVPTDFGDNLARRPGVLVVCPEATGKASSTLGLLTNGEFESWYWNRKDEPWSLLHPAYPVHLELDLPAATRIGRIILYALPPWQLQGSLLRYDVEVDVGGAWAPVAHTDEPAMTFPFICPVTRTSVESFYSERSIFCHAFAPVTTRRIRVSIYDATMGGGVNALAAAAGGQAGEAGVVLREVELYAR